jgi:DNA-binding response OmpR family regulator
MREYLEQNGYNVYESENGEQALEMLDKAHIDLIITDIMMPLMDGYTLSDEIRQSGNDIPILMVTAKETLDDKRKGFNIGIDDYMVKPIDIDEMILRVCALLRRSKTASERKLVVGSTILNLDGFTINEKELPKKEFLLIFKLLSQPGRIFTRFQLMEEIWGYDSESDVRTIDVHIKRLREKVEENPDFEIVTVKGLGYKAVKK